MKVSQRIEHLGLCQGIKLTKEEQKAVKNAGWSIGAFRDGNLVEAHYVLRFTKISYSLDLQVSQALKICSQMADKYVSDGMTVWGGICSCGEFCEPFEIHLNKPESLARLAKVIGEQILEN